MNRDLTPASGLATTRAVLADAERRLRNAGVPSPSADAIELLSFATGRPRGRLIMSDPVAPDELVRFEALVARRAGRVPLQHLTGTAGFRYLDVLVGHGVFVPRPETELVAEAALREVLAHDPRRTAVDLCAGSGAIGLSLATEASEVDVIAVEVDPCAADWADRNSERCAEAVAARGSTYRLLRGDATDPAVTAEWHGVADVVVTNPPYIPEGAVPRDPEVREHDPAIALYGGPDGLAVVRQLVGVAAALLKPGGLFVIEHGDLQGEAANDAGVPALLRSDLFTGVVDRPDLAGRPRITLARRARSTTGA